MCLRNAALLFSLGVVGHWVTTVLNVLRGDWLGFIQPHHIHCVYNTHTRGIIIITLITVETVVPTDWPLSFYFFRM